MCLKIAASNWNKSKGVCQPCTKTNTMSLMQKRVHCTVAKEYTVASRKRPIKMLEFVRQFPNSRGVLRHKPKVFSLISLWLYVYIRKILFIWTKKVVWSPIRSTFQNRFYACFYHLVVLLDNCFDFFQLMITHSVVHLKSLDMHGLVVWVAVVGHYSSPQR